MLICGCESASRRPYPETPLLTNRKPVEGKVENAGPALLARNDIPAPPLPPEALASAKTLAESLTKGEAVARDYPAGVPAKPAVGTVREPVPAITVSRVKQAPEVTALPAVRRQVPETYGHGADYTWLQGVLEKHAQGSWELRFCDPAVKDKWGGKVTLTADPCLTPFKDGDLILVQGEVLQDQGAPNAWRHFPHYRVREIWLVERKSGQ
jgi:hypothetical protein